MKNIVLQDTDEHGAKNFPWLLIIIIMIMFRDKFHPKVSFIFNLLDTQDSIRVYSIIALYCKRKY